MGSLSILQVHIQPLFLINPQYIHIFLQKAPCGQLFCIYSVTDFLFLQYFPPSLPSLFCHNRTEQEQRPRCMSPGRLRHGPESTAVFHIKPKNTWDSLLLSLRVCISSRESPFSTQRSSLPHKCLNNCLPFWIHSPLAGQGLEDWNWGAGHVFLVVKPLWWHMWDIEYK